MDGLMGNLAKLHTTELGIERIKRNLELEIENDAVVSWCKARILNQAAVIERVGKNWYATAGDCRITINAHSFTIITAHRLKE